VTPSIRRNPLSREDVDQAAVYLADHNPDAGFRFLESLESSFRRLAEMPAMGAVRTFPVSPWQDMRFFPVTGFPLYLIFYRPLAGGIEILRVLHAARDLPTLFK